MRTLLEPHLLESGVSLELQACGACCKP
jgi:hypothetical protein